MSRSTTGSMVAAEGLVSPLAAGALERLGIVAAEREFSVDIAVARVEL